jgi:hypothetical protein
MKVIKTFQQIEADYVDLLDNLDNLIDSVIQKHRQEVESEINSVCVQVMDDDNSTKLQVIVISPKDVNWFEKYNGIYSPDNKRPSRIISDNIRRAIGKEIEEFIVRYAPEFYFYRRYDGE